MIAVVEPWYKSLETGRRMAVLARDLGLERVGLVANKVRGDEDVELVRRFADTNEIELLGVVPHDDGFPAAERAGKAPLDHAPDTPAVRAITELASRLVADGRA